MPFQKLMKYVYAIKTVKTLFLNYYNICIQSKVLNYINLIKKF